MDNKKSVALYDSSYGCADFFVFSIMGQFACPVPAWGRPEGGCFGNFSVLDGHSLKATSYHFIGRIRSCVQMEK